MINPTKNQLILGGVILTAVAGTGLYIRHKNKKDQPKKDAKKYSESTVGTYNVIETAQQLGMDLGIHYSWYDLRSVTENDTAVRDTLMSWPKSLIKPLVIQFATRYNKNLQAECQRLLPASYYAQIRDKFL